MLQCKPRHSVYVCPWALYVPNNISHYVLLYVGVAHANIGSCKHRLRWQTFANIILLLGAGISIWFQPCCLWLDVWSEKQSRKFEGCINDAFSQPEWSEVLLVSRNNVYKERGRHSSTIPHSSLFWYSLW